MIDKEPPLDPDRAIIDPHLHVWDIVAVPGLLRAPQRFLIDEAMGAIIASGHRITHSVFVECHQMYRRDGPEELRSVGEVEFTRGIAAMSDSGQYGATRLCHRIVANANLLLGGAVTPVLDALAAAAGSRLCGVRVDTAWSEAGLFGDACDPARRHLLRDPRFIAGARTLADRGLSLDVWCLHSQLTELIELADAVPGLTIILDHLGTPERLGRWAGQTEAIFTDWSRLIDELGRRDNVVVKLGGLGMDISRNVGPGTGPAISADLARDWRRWVEHAIAAFSPARAMFESNFPPDRAIGSYGAVWNAFKRIVADYTDAERDLLFAGTAAAIYHITPNRADGG